VSGIKPAMPRGAFVMLDVLGFKGIWRREDPSLVLAKLVTIAARAKLYAEARLQGPGMIPLRGTLRFEVSMLSDTIAGGISLEEAAVEAAAQPFGSKAALGGLEGLSVKVAGDFASEVVRAAADGPIPLALRGAIAFGQFMMQAQSMLGPAVDEAAECEKLAEAAIVYCAPSALQVLEELRAPLRPGPFVHWGVPLRGGRAYETFAVAPWDRDADVTSTVWTAIKDTFDRRRMDVELKRQRTQQFLRHAQALFEEDRKTTASVLGGAAVDVSDKEGH
jgi:hypothetical protein